MAEHPLAVALVAAPAAMVEELAREELVEDKSEPARLGLASIDAPNMVLSVSVIEGVSVKRADAWWLVDELRRRGRADDVTVAFAIEVSIHSGESLDGLADGEKDAILEALCEAPTGLYELRGALGMDWRNRR